MPTLPKVFMLPEKHLFYNLALLTLSALMDSAHGHTDGRTLGKDNVKAINTTPYKITGNIIMNIFIGESSKFPKS